MEQNKVRSQRYKTLIDCVDIEDHNVFNRVVDSAKLDQVIFIPTEAEAAELLSRQQTVPRGLLHASVPSYQYFPAPNYRSTLVDTEHLVEDLLLPCGG